MCLGVGTIGLYLKQSFENAYYREVWTYLYALLILILIFDRLSALLRKRLV